MGNYLITTVEKLLWNILSHYYQETTFHEANIASHILAYPGTVIRFLVSWEVIFHQQGPFDPQLECQKCFMVSHLLASICQYWGTSLGSHHKLIIAYFQSPE